MKKLFFILSLLCSISIISQPKWQLLSPGTTGVIWGIDIVSPQIIWITADNGDVKRSTDGGTTWLAAGNAGQGAYSVAAIDANNAVVSLGPSAGDGKIMRTTNGGTSWTQVYTATGCWFNFVDNIDNSKFWALSDPLAGVFHVVKSTDGGASWTTAANPPTQPATDVFGANNSYYRIGNTAWFGCGNASTSTTQSNRVYKTTTCPDGPWTYATTTNQGVGSVAFNSAAGNGICGFWSITTNVNRSDNGGTSWTNQTTTIGNVRGLDYIPTTNWCWAATSTGMFYTTNNGATWTADILPTGVTQLSSVKFFNDANVGFAGGTGVLLKSLWGPVVPVELTSFTGSQNGNNINLNWSTATEQNNHRFEIERKIINGTSTSEWTMIGFKQGKGTTTEKQNYFYTDNIKGITAQSIAYRLKQVDFNGAFEYSKEVLIENIKPIEFTLEQNYPNPFNPSTMIKFQMPVEKFVTLKIYNSLGQEVKTLVNEVRNAGVHQVEVNGKELGSGIYYGIIRTSDNEFNQTIKMNLMK